MKTEAACRADKKWRESHREQKRKIDRLYYQKNVEKVLKKNRQWNLDHPEFFRSYQRQWHLENMGSARESNRRSKIKRQQRIPQWADLKAIRRFYQDCPSGMVIDHTIPLRGKTVSGLHVLSNLQYLTPEENKKKSNNFGRKADVRRYIERQ